MTYPLTITPYSRLNDTLNEIIFNGRFADLPVYIDVEGDLKDEICLQLGLEEDQLTEYVGEVVEETLAWDNKNDIYIWHRANRNNWYREREKPPPFTALLLVLSIAAENMGAEDDISSINFYGRVAQIFGNSSYKDQISKSSKTTVLFWEDLNNWLVENDFAYGRPTAKPILPKWKYASYALSQALVRRSDRDSFHRLFDEFNLSKSDQLTFPEIEPYINEWMTGAGPTLLLKKLWKVNDLRNRVIEAAIEELEIYENSKKNKGNIRSGRLIWISQFQTYPIKKLKLKLCAGQDPSSDKYSLFSDNYQSSSQDLISNSISLNYFDGQEVSFLGPTSSLQLEDLIISDLSLTKEDTKHFEKKCRSIIPLLKQDNGFFYKEVSQILLFHQYQIICAISWKQKIINFLDAYAATGFEVMDSEPHNGIPFGWCLFNSVEIVKVPDDSLIHDDLNALIPSERGLALYPSGGLKLSGASDIWHKWAPPSIFAVNKGEPRGLKVSSENIDNEFLVSVDDSVNQPNFLYKGNESILRDIESDSFSFITYGGKLNEKNSAKTIYFRSANAPKKHPMDKLFKNKYLVDPYNQVLNWRSASDEKSDNYLVGLDVTNLEEKELNHNTYSYRRISYLATNEIDYIDQIDGSYRLYHGLKNKPVCVERGVHAWLMPEGVTSKTKRAIQQCVDCGIRGVYRGKSSSLKRRVKKSDGIANKSQLNEKKLNPNRVDVQINHDLLLDAISYEGQGSGQILYKWFGMLVDESWKIEELIRDYVNLGFIDTMLISDSSRVKNWTVSPSVFVINEQGLGYLAGFRSDFLVNQVCMALDNFNVIYEPQRFDTQPTLHLWRIKKEIQDNVIEALYDLKLNHKLEILKNPWQKILPWLPSRKNMISSSKPITPQVKDLQKFDVISATWKDWESVLKTGAYRHKELPRRYFYVNQEIEVRQMTYELTKISAAYDQRIRLHDYNSKSMEFICVLGCRLPSLYERLLISCSGQLPKLMDKKFLIYKNIPSEIGERVLEALYGE